MLSYCGYVPLVYQEIKIKNFDQMMSPKLIHGLIDALMSHLDALTIQLRMVGTLRCLMCYVH